MKKLTHSESEIIKSVNELDAGIPANEICNRLNISCPTLYQWKRIKELEEENAKLKKMYANLALDNEILREVIKKNSKAEFHVSITLACNLMGIYKSYFYYDLVKDDLEIETAIRQKTKDGGDTSKALACPCKKSTGDTDERKRYMVNRFCVLNIIDDCDRVAINGPEFISQELQNWCKENAVLIVSNLKKMYNLNK